MSGWYFMIGAIGFEICGTLAMRFSDGFRNLLPSCVMVICYLICFSLLTVALKSIELGIAYAIWSGLGTAVIAVAGVFFFDESLNLVKVLSICLIIAGVVGLNLSQPH